MSVLNPLKNPWFGMTSLTGKVDKMDYVPQYLGGLGIFDPDPSRTYDLFVDRRDQTLTLVPTSELGSPPDQLTRDTRDVVALAIPRIAQSFTLHTHELIGLRGFSTEETFMNYQVEYLRRFNKMRRRMELTEEFHRLGAIQGILLDADGTTEIENYYTKFGVTAATDLEFEFSSATFDVDGYCRNVVRAITRASRGAMVGNARVHSLCGDTFYDNLITHPNVEKFYLNWAAANNIKGREAFQAFEFGNMVFHNYRGTDDNSTVAIAPTKARLFPVGAQDTFTKAMGPAEFGPLVNQPGRDFYAYNLLDPSGRDAWTMGELYAYPLYFCQRPDLLRSATAT